MRPGMSTLKYKCGNLSIFIFNKGEYTQNKNVLLILEKGPSMEQLCSVLMLKFLEILTHVEGNRILRTKPLIFCLPSQLIPVPW